MVPQGLELGKKYTQRMDNDKAFVEIVNINTILDGTMIYQLSDDCKNINGFIKKGTILEGGRSWPYELYRNNPVVSQSNVPLTEKKEIVSALNADKSKKSQNTSKDLYKIIGELRTLREDQATEILSLKDTNKQYEDEKKDLQNKLEQKGQSLSSLQQEYDTLKQEKEKYELDTKNKMSEKYVELDGKYKEVLTKAKNFIVKYKAANSALTDALIDATSLEEKLSSKEEEIRKLKEENKILRVE